jgi:hypothetical protein
VDGVAFPSVDIEIFWGEGQVDLEKSGRQRTVEALPGERIVETLPLPAPGTLVRAAARAVVGRSRGQRSLILALEAQAPLVPPRELGARLRERGVVLSWKGAMPDPVEAPDLGSGTGSPVPFADLFAPRAETDPADEGSEDEAEDPAGEPPEAVGETPADTTGEAPSTPTAEGEPAEDSAAGKASDTPAEEDEEEAASETPPPPRHGFRVYRRFEGAPFGVPLNYQPQERRVFTDAAAPVGRTVCYVVRAVGSVEPLIESAPSNEVCLEVRDVVPPAPPSGLAVVPRAGGLEVVWSPGGEAGLASYRIYRGVGDGEPERVGEVPAGTTTWLDTTGESGVLYRYRVSAVDAAGNEGAPSGSAEGIRQ